MDHMFATLQFELTTAIPLHQDGGDYGWGGILIENIYRFDILLDIIIGRHRLLKYEELKAIDNSWPIYFERWRVFVKREKQRKAPLTS
jgi:hypothetical protein